MNGFRLRRMDGNFGCGMMGNICKNVTNRLLIVIMMVVMVVVMMVLTIAVVMMMADGFFVVMVGHKAVDQR